MTDHTDIVRTRFAPSPTGMLHVGAYRTALFNWLFARQHEGELVLRIEDTDRERSTQEYEDNILESLEWLGFAHDRFMRQSQRVERHRELLERLVQEGHAYISAEEPSREGQRAEVIRFRNPNREVTFHDRIRGEVTFDTSSLGDFVLAKSMEEPLFHLAVVADDADAGISHVIRGEDHISNTPRQMLIREALGFTHPDYAHIPLILASDKSKLSKRNGARAITEYRDEGFLADGLINFMALLGWSPGTDEEIFTPSELMQRFSLDGVQKAGAVFDEVKLRSINREHIKMRSAADLREPITQFLKRSERAKEYGWKITEEVVSDLEELIYERIETFDDARAMLDSGELDWYFVRPTIEDPSVLIWKHSEAADTRTHLAHVQELIETIEEDNFIYQSIKDAVWGYADEQGRGDVLWPFRYALSGREKSPDPFQLASILGKTETLARLANAHAML